MISSDMIFEIEHLFVELFALSNSTSYVKVFEPRYIAYLATSDSTRETTT